MDTGKINEFANNANKIVPTPKSTAQSIDAIVKKSGDIVGYHLSGGQTVSKSDGVRLAKAGEIKGVAVAENQGSEYLRALPDGEENNNLSSLPTITE